jgi:hypothetical protein
VRLIQVRVSFNIAELSGLLGAKPLRLNKLLNVCQIRASVVGGGARGKRRAFSAQDVCRLGFALWLWRAGLRGPALRRVMGGNVIHRLVSELDTLREIQRESRRHRLLIAVDFRGASTGYREVALVGSPAAATNLLKEASGVVVPIGKLLESLAKRLEEFVKI